MFLVLYVQSVPTLLILLMNWLQRILLHLVWIHFQITQVLRCIKGFQKIVSNKYNFKIQNLYLYVAFITKLMLNYLPFFKKLKKK